MTYDIDLWQGCYPTNWKGLIVSDAMKHPAKFSSKLIRRIYEHAMEEGWIKEGDRVFDPFGGVALGGLEAMRHGLHWTGMELEPRFADIGNGYDCPGFAKQQWRRLQGRFNKLQYKQIHLCQECLTLATTINGSRQIPSAFPHHSQGNIDLWHKKFSRMPHWGTARLLTGDSRKLLQIIQCSDLAVSSPPYNLPMSQEHNGKRNGKRGSTPSEAGAFVSYGTADGQLEGMSDDGFDLALSSPPYAETGLNYEDNGLIEGGKPYKRKYMEDRDGKNYGGTPGQLGDLKAKGYDLAVSSPPFLQSEGGTPEPKPGGSIDHALYARHAAGNAAADAYGKSDGQMSSMKDQDFDLAVSSPPFKTETHGSGLNVNKPASFRGVLKDGSLSTGDSPDNLANLPTDDFDLAVSSPPFENSLGKGTAGVAIDRRALADSLGFSNTDRISPVDMERIGKATQTEYGLTPGQLGNDEGDSFWMAARTIIDQTYAALRPGGHAVWVVKAYVKNKKYVDFPDQWRRLCEAAGFKTIHEHHAMLVHSRGSSHTLEGGIVNHQSESKSFFRRLAEKKGSPPINWETVFCMVKE